MMKIKRKILSGVLAFAMMVTQFACLSNTVFANSAREVAPVVWPEEGEGDPAERVNLALNKPATASKDCVDGGTHRVAKFAVDGNESTRWYDGDIENEAGNWLQVDLGASYGLDEIEVLWANLTIAYKYEIQVSENGTDWKHIYTADSFGSETKHTFNVCGSGRYVRVYVLKRGDWGNSICEFRVYGSDDHKAGNHLDAENGTLLPGSTGALSIVELKEACGGKYVDGFQGSGTEVNNGSGVEFTPENLFDKTRTYLMSLGYSRYFYEKADKIGIYVNDVRVKDFDLVSETDNVNKTIKSAPFEIQLKKGDKVAVKVDTSKGDKGFLRLDYVEMGLKINRPSRDVTFAYPHLALDVDETAKIIANYKGSSELEYFVENAEIASITGDVVKGVKAGTTRVMARVKSSPAVYAVGKITVGSVPDGAFVPSKSIALADESISIVNKKSVKANVTVVPDTAKTAVTWETSDKTVATVANGTIKALSEGTATITAKSIFNDAIFDTVAVTVTPNDEIAYIENEKLKVAISTKFPLVYEYKLLSNGGIIQGNPNEVNKIKINNKEYTPSVEYTKISTSEAKYILTVKEMNASITMTLKVEQDNFKLDVTEIKEDGADDKRIFTFEMPRNAMISMTNKEDSPSFAGSMMECNIAKTGDVFNNLKFYDKADASPNGGFIYAFLSNAKVSAGIRSNGMDSKLLKQTVKAGDTYTTSLWNGTWRYRANDYTKKFQDTRGDYGNKNEVVTKTYKAEYTEELPLIYISFAGDVNNDKYVDWQDGAVKFRDIAAPAIGSEKIPDAVVQRLVFPQSNTANYTYIESLDETKRAYLQTDGLGQLVLNKYHNEGIWGDLSVYDDNIGGHRDFNKYISDATQKYNSWLGVHTNFTEIYGKAKNFRPEKILMQEDGVTPVGYGFEAYSHWLQQVYSPDIDFDAISLERQKDMVAFKKAVPDLGFIYSDVFSGGGWKGRRLAEDYKAADISYFVEWPYQNEEEAVWSHWAVEKPYSPPSLKAYASDIARFIFNDTKDRWDNNSDYAERYPNSCNLLMGADTTTYECWPQGNTSNSFDKSMQVVFDNNLPTKYMQHFPITKMEKDSDGWATHIWFEQGVEVYQDKDNSNKRTIKKDGKVIYNQDSYLIPWDEGDMDNPANEAKEVKLYHWNENGGTTTWQLPNSWDGLKTVYIYELTDLGKTNKKVLDVTSGAITINDVKAKTPYIVCKGDAGATEDVLYGEGSLVENGTFNYGDFKGWTVDKGQPAVSKNDTKHDNMDKDFLAGVGWWGVRSAPYGQQRGYEVIIDGTEETQISQVIDGLAPGEYAASVMVEIQQDKQRKASMIIDNGVQTFSNFADKSILYAFNEYDIKLATYMTRMRVNFVVPEGKDSVTLMLNAQAGDGRVRFDTARVYATTTPVPEEGRAKDEVIFYQDYEMAVDEASTDPLTVYKPTYEEYYPFYLGGANGVRDSRTSIQKAHAPFTNNGTAKWDPSTVNLDDTLAGDRSIKVTGVYDIGMAVQTIPQIIRFDVGQKYRVSFKYQTQPVDDYQFVIGDGKPTSIDAKGRKNPDNLVYTETLSPTSTTKIFSHEFTANSDQNWFGIYRNKLTMSVWDNPAPLVIDDILVEKIEEISEKFTVIYKNGATDATGAAPAQNPVPANTQITVAKNTFAREGYIFAGWSDGTKTYQPGDSYTVVAGNVTFTARWEKAPVVALPVSQGKPATASTWVTDQGVDRTPDFAFDGIETGASRWYDGISDPENPQGGNIGNEYVPQWLAVDLGEVHDITKIDIVWENSKFPVYSPKYEIQVSDDGVNYSKVWDGTATSGDAQSIEVAAKGKHVRLYILKAGWWGTSVQELKVWGTPSTVDPTDANKADLIALVDYAKAQKSAPEYKFVVPVVKNALDLRISAAEAIIANTTATQAEVDSAYAKLLEVVHMLSYTGDSTTLKENYDTWVSFKQEDYTTITANALVKALGEAKLVLDNENALQAEIDAANDILVAAINGLEKGADMSGLLAKIAQANVYNGKLDSYIDNNGRKEFVAALANANAVAANKDSTAAEIKEARDRLELSFYGLREIPNKDKLQELINQANALDVAGYTVASVKARAEAISFAQTVMADKMATQEDVDKAIAGIEKTTRNLVLVTDEKTDDKETTDKETTTDKTDKTEDTKVPTTADKTPLAVVFALAMVGCACVVVRKKATK